MKVQCTNVHCPMGGYLHRHCYDAWEDLLVKLLGGISWARRWTEAQCRANLWDKKGFLLIAKACKCRCGAGQLKRDLDYAAVSHLYMETDYPWSAAASPVNSWHAAHG